jgi:hypothetical protein
MVRKTPNHGLNKWEKGDPDWTHAPDMQTIEERLVIRDEERAIEEGRYETHDGAMFIATDTGAVYESDGSSWTQPSRELDSVRARNATITDAVTWPDGTTTTGPGSRRDISGVVYTDADGTHVAESLVTGNGPFRDENDAGTVIQSLIEDIASNEPQVVGGNATVGRIAVARGQYQFETTATITAPGVTIVGASDYEWGKDGPTQFVPDGLPSGQALVRIESNACTIRNVTMDLRGRDVYGIHIWDTDRHNLRYLVIESVGSGGEGLRVSGSYQSTITQCQIRQAHFRINPDSGKNPNNTIMDKCLFQHSVGSVPPLRYAGNGNEIHGCRINQGDATPADSGVSGIAASPSGPTKGWEFYNCKFFGSNAGGVMVEGRRLKFNGCSFGGGGDAIFDTLGHTQVQGCEFNVNHQLIKLDGRNNQLEKCIVSGNLINACNESGTAAIETTGSGGRNDAFAIVGNTFIGGGEYDIDFAENGARSGLVSGNHVENGIRERWGGDAFDVHIRNNHGYNPVGYARDTPPLPDGTGSNNQVVNAYGQSAVVHQTGQEGVHVVRRDGTEHEVAPDPPTVTVPPFGKIYYEDSTPSEWIWYWE